MIHRLLARRARYFVCMHRSHVLRLRCYREATYDHQCGKHNDLCWNGCPKEVR